MFLMAASQSIDDGCGLPEGGERRAGSLDFRARFDIHINPRISMEVVMQVGKWGNSLAVRLPAAVVEALELEEGDEVEIRILDAREFAVARRPGREELLKRLRGFRGRLPEDFKFDRDEANAR